MTWPVVWVSLLVLVGVVLLAYLTYVALATSLYLLRASRSDSAIVRISSKLFPGIARRIEEMRGSMPTDQLMRTDEYFRRGVRRGKRALARGFVIAAPALLLVALLLLLFRCP